MVHLRSIRMGASARWFAAAGPCPGSIPAIAGAAGNAPSPRRTSRSAPARWPRAAGCHARVITNRSGTPSAGSGPSRLWAGGLPQRLRAAEHGTDRDRRSRSSMPTTTRRSRATSPCSARPMACPPAPRRTAASQGQPERRRRAVSANRRRLGAGDRSRCRDRVRRSARTARSCWSRRHASIADLGTSVNTAVGLGATEISNSYGGAEYSGETAYDTASYKHPGVAITARRGRRRLRRRVPGRLPVRHRGRRHHPQPGRLEQLRQRDRVGPARVAVAAPTRRRSPGRLRPQTALTGCGPNAGSRTSPPTPTRTPELRSTTTYQYRASRDGSRSAARASRRR